MHLSLSRECNNLGVLYSKLFKLYAKLQKSDRSFLDDNAPSKDSKWWMRVYESFTGNWVAFSKSWGVKHPWQKLMILFGWKKEPIFSTPYLFLGWATVYNRNLDLFEASSEEPQLFGFVDESQSSNSFLVLVELDNCIGNHIHMLVGVHTARNG